MDVLVPAVLVVAVFVVPLGALVLLARRARRHGGIGGLMGPFEQMWHPGATRAHLELRGQEERPAPAPLPGDGPLRRYRVGVAVDLPGLTPPR